MPDIAEWWKALTADGGMPASQGGAPEGVEYVDQEEEYVVDPVSGEGRWVAVGTGSVPLAPPPPPGVCNVPAIVCAADLVTF